MKGLLLIGVLLASLCSSALVDETITAQSTANPLIVQEEARFEDFLTAKLKYRAWNQLCFQYASATGRTCGSIKPPNVKREAMRAGLRGYYDGGDTVFINRTLRAYQREATLVHEMSHYLDTQLGLNPEMPVKRSQTKKVYGLCVSEKRAWDLTDQYWRDILRGERAVDGDWVKWYDHCRQFADRLYPEIYDAPLPERRWLWSRSRGLNSN